MFRELFQIGKPLSVRKLGNIIGCIMVLASAIIWWTGRNNSHLKSSSYDYEGLNLQTKLMSQAPLTPLLFEEAETQRIREILSRVEKYAPLHARFAATSVAIAQNEMQKALSETLSLENELRKCEDSQEISFLHAFTLVRIAFLHQSLGQKENEKRAWESIQTHFGVHDKRGAEIKGPLSSSLALLEANFNCEGCGLRDYISHRLSQLL